MLQELYEYFGLISFGGEPSKWVWECVERWKGHMSKIGVDDDHFMRGVGSVTAAAAAISTSAFLPFTSCSTIALHALLYIWAFLTPERLSSGR